MTHGGRQGIWRLLIRTLPPHLRADYADEVEEHLQWLVAVHRKRMGLLRFWLFVFVDFFRVAVGGQSMLWRVAAVVGVGLLAVWAVTGEDHLVEVSNMGMLWVVAIVVAAWVAILTRQVQRQRTSVPVVLAVCPVALLFLTVPTSAAFLDLVRGFQGIAETGQGGLSAISPFCIDVVRSQASGGAAFLLTMAVAALIQVRWPMASGQTAATVSSRAGLWPKVLVGSSALMLPVGLYALLASSVPRLIMQYTVSPDGPHALSGAGLGAASETFAFQSLAAILSGAALGTVLVLLSVGALFTVRRVRMSPSMGSYSWWVLATAAGIGVWVVGSATVDGRTFAAMLG